MLELKGITKVYPTGNEPVHALRGIDLQFRQSEFVSILGPSGCGKTTMLNILGGLDQYTEGDLVIHGVSTKKYKDRDWDAYRNHSIGFVFQSYNLIPHQSVLHNVELALTLSGVSKGERRRRAKAALERVGLGDQLKKKPGALSGGQMQRVAIARAIVNDPAIVLADEPTGALDTETSVQVMEILKEIARDRLVIMVTHNPELAEQYSTRIVKMLDGRILDDSAPLTAEESAAEQAAAAPAPKKGRKKKPSMSFATSFGLSLKNLFTKKGRTVLTAFAGSIGIIGIALIYAVSQGTNDFINAVQEQTLTSYPLTIESKPIDLLTLLAAFANREQDAEPHDNDAVYQKAMLYELMNDFASLEDKTNDLRSFKAFLEKKKADPDSAFGAALTGIKYTYDADLLIYTEGVDGVIRRSDTSELMRELMSEYMGVDMTAASSTSTGTFSTSSSLMTTSTALWRELLTGNDGETVNPVTKKQYQLLYGAWPEQYNEVVLFLDKNNELNDLTLYALGLKSKEEMSALMKASANKEVVEVKNENWSYEDVCGMELRTILPADCYNFDEAKGVYTDLRETDAGMKYLYDNGLTLKVVGIVKPDESAVASSNQSGYIGYTHALTEYLSEHTEAAPAVAAQKADVTTDIFTGLPFKGDKNMTDAQKATFLRDHIATLDETGKAALFVKVQSVPDKADVEAYVAQATAAVDRATIEAQMLQSIGEQTGMAAESVQKYLASMSDEQLETMYADSVRQVYRRQYAAGVMARIRGLSPAQMAAALEEAAAGYTDEEAAALYDEVLTFSSASYEGNLSKLGVIDLDSPSTINLFASTFENKDIIEATIADYNESVDDLQKIEYTDYVGLIISSMTTVINAIYYVLIAFVAVSLIVSSIMIGVITLISVQERTKEIGILRAIGASKRNVSQMFNAETLIIGFASGLLGVLITFLACLPLNALIHHWTGLMNLSARLPVTVAVVLVFISMLLSMIAGLIPSLSAASKDPVVALRTE